MEAKVKAEQPQSMEAMLAVIANLQERIAVLETRGSRGRQYLDDWEVSKKLQEVPDGPPAHPSSSDSMGELSQTADEQRRIPLEGYPAGNREALELDTARGKLALSFVHKGTRLFRLYIRFNYNRVRNFPIMGTLFLMSIKSPETRLSCEWRMAQMLLKRQSEE